jgi:hypothetical protein
MAVMGGSWGKIVGVMVGVHTFLTHRLLLPPMNHPYYCYFGNFNTLFILHIQYSKSVIPGACLFVFTAKYICRTASFIYHLLSFTMSMALSIPYSKSV